MLLKQFKDTVSRYKLIKRGDRIVAGVSGGPDSVTLLYLLVALKREWGLHIHVAHLDHMMRPGSHTDALYVRRLAQRLKLPATIGSCDCHVRDGKGSPEEQARTARFAFLIQVARTENARCIALGHTRDDQAETVLMRMLRGSGLNGLAGILPRRTISGIEIIRPLLEVRRKHIEAFLRRKGITACADPSNNEEIFFRNKIRRSLIPLLEKEYNPNCRDLLGAMAEHIADDYDYILAQARSVLSRMKGRLTLARMRRLHPCLQRVVIRLAIAQRAGDTRRLSFQHMREIEDLIYSRPVNSIVDLPKGITVKKTPTELRIEKRSPRRTSP